MTLGQPAHAQRTTPDHLDRLNALLAGRVLDFTHNHGRDNRRYSSVLCQPRDLYVYVPPHYSPQRAYPLVLWLHGAFGDEHTFLDQGQLQYLDEMIQRGCIPPMIVACPDGTIHGENGLSADHSLYLNGVKGRFQDHVLCELYPFLFSNFAVLANREAHAIIGVSAGGTGALNLAMKRTDLVGVVATIAGAANLRYSNMYGDYLADFSPATYRWKTTYDPDEVIARYAAGLISIRARRFVEPVFGAGPGVVARVARENPADLLFAIPPAPGELTILLHHGGRDQFNMDAQDASFAWLATTQGLWIEVMYDPDGDHTSGYFSSAQREVLQWLAARIARPAPIHAPARHQVSRNANQPAAPASNGAGRRQQG
ncbi:MAG: esterase family protein, partial [Planctomycetes bacterium]|nr:esterase family protein [Planctomycetota bacterium]